MAIKAKGRSKARSKSASGAKASAGKRRAKKAAAPAGAAPPAVSIKPSPIQINPREIHRRVQVEAYYLFEKRGRWHGHDLGDWFEAEKRIRVKK